MKQDVNCLDTDEFSRLWIAPDRAADDAFFLAVLVFARQQCEDITIISAGYVSSKCVKTFLTTKSPRMVTQGLHGN